MLKQNNGGIMMKKAISLILSAVMMFTLTSSVFAEQNTIEEKNISDYNQDKIVYDMGAGWNLGNQLEAVNNDGIPNETNWGNPVVTKELITLVKESGFNTIRIPVSYFFKIGEAPDYIIKKAWLDRIQEVVDYAYSQGMYVIINIHGDGYYTINNSWILLGDYNDIKNASEEDLAKEQERVDNMVDKYAKVWRQIANRFASYDEHLIFESMNEMQSKQASTAYSKIFYPVLNRLNQTFIDTVRQSDGEYNSKRWLEIPGWFAGFDTILNDSWGFKIPTDDYRSSEIPADQKRIMIAVHFYEPSNFCLGSVTDYTTWGREKDIKNIDEKFKAVNEKFVSQGYPIVIGEYGSVNKQAADPKNPTYRAAMYKEICSKALEYGLVPICWDNGYVDVGDPFGLFDRKNCTVAFPEIVAAATGVYSKENIALDKFKKRLPKLNQNEYTTESWNALQQVIKNAENSILTSNLSENDIEALYKNVMTSIGKLVKKSDVIKTNNPPVKTTKSTASTRSANAVKKDKLSAKKAMNQAKIRKLKVKSNSKKKINVTWKKVKKAKGYEIQVSNNKKFKKNKIILKKTLKKTKLTIKNKKIKSKKTYYIRVRAYAEYKNINNKTIKVYSKWNKHLRKIKVK